MEPGVAVLSYFVVPDEILCWVVRKEMVELIRWPVNRDSLGTSILEYRRMIQNIEPLEERSQELFTTLVSPVLESIKDSNHIGIVPHGFLHYLSFATLYDSQRYVADRFPLFYLPSSSVLRYTLSRRTDAKNVRVLAVGNPDLNDPALSLPFAEQEVDTIRWNFDDVTILTGKKATEGWVREHIWEFGVIHLASHGEFDPINPIFSAVMLAKDENYDGDLEVEEIFGLQINADLVLLSACQTGLGKITKGDDVIGLNRSFFYAGTHSVISSLWRVSDISTAVLIKQFYRFYDRHDKSESLRKAMLHVKNRHPHPGYWGAFILVGDYY
jgi:CHAT domain-containing protein